MTAASRWEWLDFDEAESEQVREFLSHGVDGEGVDALRIGASVRDRVSDRLFPGTSTQYTRLRYLFLVPALLRKKGGTYDNLSQNQYLLNVALDNANRDEKGVFGRRTPGRDFVRLYWSAVRKWGLLTPTTADPRDVTIANGIAAMQIRLDKDEDGNVLAEPRVHWDPIVVKLADQFWSEHKKGAVPSIHCTQAEVDFIVNRWSELSNSAALCAIATQLKAGRVVSNADEPWDLDVGDNFEARAELDRAKAISLICWAVQLAYNFALLEQARILEANGEMTTWQQKGQSLVKTEERISKLFEQWKAAYARERKSIEEWTAPSQWSDMGGDAAQHFLATSAQMLMKNKTDLRSSEWSSKVKDREKVNPAPKLSNPIHLATWSGTPEMARRWDFRWRASVRQFIQDAENPLG